MMPSWVKTASRMRPTHGAIDVAAPGDRVVVVARGGDEQLGAPDPDRSEPRPDLVGHRGRHPPLPSSTTRRVCRILGWNVSGWHDAGVRAVVQRVTSAAVTVDGEVLVRSDVGCACWWG